MKRGNLSTICKYYEVHLVKIHDLHVIISIARWSWLRRLWCERAFWSSRRFRKNDRNSHVSRHENGSVVKTKPLGASVKVTINMVTVVNFNERKSQLQLPLSLSLLPQVLLDFFGVDARLKLLVVYAARGGTRRSRWANVFVRRWGWLDEKANQESRHD